MTYIRSRPNPKRVRWLSSAYPDFSTPGDAALYGTIVTLTDALGGFFAAMIASFANTPPESEDFEMMWPLTIAFVVGGALIGFFASVVRPYIMPKYVWPPLTYPSSAHYDAAVLWDNFSDEKKTELQLVYDTVLAAQGPTAKDLGGFSAYMLEPQSYEAQRAYDLLKEASDEWDRREQARSAKPPIDLKPAAQIVMRLRAEADEASHG
jgi:hypothetical protein